MDNELTENKNLLLSTAYMPPVSYFAVLARYGGAVIDLHEHYIKQTYRNRCEIYSANGKLSLVVPVIKPDGNHTAVKNIEIANTGKWRLLHWRALVSAYNRSPFFLYYKDEIEPFFHRKYELLFEFNYEILKTLCQILELEVKIDFSTSYIEKNDKQYIDFRNAFSPKKPFENMFSPYVQVFGDKHGFISNLSILDLIFNEGPNAGEYIEEIKNQF